jgi:hypothetical protein
MSRDWTPKQLYLVDKQMNNKLRNQTITLELNGETTIIHDPNGEMEKAFPNLTFIGGDVFKRLKEKSSVEFIYDVESVLTAITELLDSYGIPAREIADSDIEANVKESLWQLAKLVRDWFEGKLDPGFYYNELNNAIFLEKLLEMCN